MLSGNSGVGLSFGDLIAMALEAKKEESTEEVNRRLGRSSLISGPKDGSEQVSERTRQDLRGVRDVGWNFH